LSIKIESIAQTHFQLLEGNLPTKNINSHDLLSEISEFIGAIFMNVMYHVSFHI
jgi:hypothetical protein